MIEETLKERISLTTKSMNETIQIMNQLENIVFHSPPEDINLRNELSEALKKTSIKVNNLIAERSLLLLQEQKEELEQLELKIKHQQEQRELQREHDQIQIDQQKEQFDKRK